MQDASPSDVTVLVDRNVPMSQFATALHEAGLAIRCDGSGLHIEPVRDKPRSAARSKHRSRSSRASKRKAARATH